MSNGLIQHLPGAYRMGGSPGLPDEPWLLPISDRPAPAADESLRRQVEASVRPLRIAASVLGAGLALLLTAQITLDWRSTPSANGMVAQALPPTIAADQAALHGGR